MQIQIHTHTISLLIDIPLALVSNSQTTEINYGLNVFNLPAASRSSMLWINIDRNIVVNSESVAFVTAIEATLLNPFGGY